MEAATNWQQLGGFHSFSSCNDRKGRGSPNVSAHQLISYASVLQSEEASSTGPKPRTLEGPAQDGGMKKKTKKQLVNADMRVQGSP